ncbi:MAG: transporter [Lewinellaceae bacterium]|nr:transporter [Saprospiraceae bacterium]MCB9332617.1 transporter [Lewinellaceae bacterium]
MKHNILPVCILALLPLFAPRVKAQTPSDAIMMEPRQFCGVLLYDHGSFDQYWEGAKLRKNGTIETVSRNSGLAMFAYGVVGQLNLIAGLPYVETHSTEPNGGKFNGANGLQDLSIALKYRFLNKQLGKGKLALISTLGFSMPVSNYLSDYRPYSLGFGAPELSLRGIIQYELDNGLYARTALAHLWRGQTEAERDYYYNNGSYYTPWMDVPNAWNYHAALGKWFFKYTLRVEAGFSGVHSVSGDDIRFYNAPQPTNKTVENLVGASAQYYFNKPKGLGVLGYFNRVIQGRNVGQTTGFGFGLTYVFKI